MNRYVIIGACAGSLLLSACSTPQGRNEQGGMFLGGAGGALGGALIGSAIGNTQGALIGAGIGALAGGFAGKSIGANMDEKERQEQIRRGY